MCCCCEFGGGGFDGGVGWGWECGYGGQEGIYKSPQSKQEKKKEKKETPSPNITFYNIPSHHYPSSFHFRLHSSAQSERIKKKKSNP